ncbi:PPOX class F420-dependent oxidoreductase [Candidatus Mycobacterium wuenschmannii]|uniref:PPOX class F420-dependent oxidoreductase n=1 Tax=Candidatus Mycobacterium wuenschmannii TaxID=3027808 RepID=A0ABY8VYS3_9MYCO|nr:PPOX class F420-dependent oxidoreductase [Candidatus Mycobacterium wuenschmannii]WIM88753.1 PPOX class F420-dependent oxidoreductase [Candidatus Mycobacterium wuenschmannii]
MHRSDPLKTARYARLRSFRRDGRPVDTPIWFAMEDGQVVFRTKVGPNTRRLTYRPDVELVACDHRGRVRAGAATWAGRATILSGPQAEQANRVLHRRYGWQWNIVPMIKVPGVTNVHRDLCFGEKLRRTRDRGVWSDSVIVRVEASHV